MASPLVAVRRLARPETAIFLGLLALYAATTNTRALYHFDLHDAVVRVLGEQGRLSLRRFYPGEDLNVDTFVYDGRVFVRRQPGVFLLGAGVYRVLRLFGVSYGHDFYLTAALVSVLTSGVLTAITAVLVYRLARERRADARWALGAALAYGVGSSALPYSGTVHHDVAATAALLGAFAHRRRPFVAAVLLGLAATCSLSSLPMLAILAATLVVGPDVEGRPLRRRVVSIVAGAALGLLPLFAIDWLAFGAPWRMPVTLGGVWPDTSPRLDLANTSHLLGIYARRLLMYTPIAVAGLAGVVVGSLPSKSAPSAPATRAENRLILVLFSGELAFLVSLGTDGYCQYGPRFLLPLMPLLCLGLTGFADRRLAGAVGPVLLVIGVLSASINLVGALYGTMCCFESRWYFADYLDLLLHRVYFSHPLLGIEGRSPY